MEKFSREQSDNLHFAVFKLQRRLRNETASITSLSATEESVLFTLSRTPRLTNAELARHEHITAQSMNKITATMMKHGVLDSGKNSRDKRRKELFLTEQGRVLVSSISQQRSRWLTATIEQEFTEEEAAQLDAALELLHKISDKTSAPTSKFIPVAPQAEQG